MKVLKSTRRGMGLAALIALSASPLLFTSCSSHEDPINSESETNGLTEISLASNVVNGNANEWASKANVASTESSSSTSTTDVTKVHASINNHVTEAKMYDQDLNASDDAEKLLKGTTRMFYPTTGENVDIYLYNGGNWEASGDVKSGSTITVTAEADQSATSGRDASDFIFGQAINKRTKESVEVTMYHMMTQFDLTVNVEEATKAQFGDLKITSIELNNLATSATYTINRDKDAYEMTPGSTTGNFTMFKSSTGVALSSWEAPTDGIAAIFVPQSVADKTLTITTSANKTFKYTFPKGITFDQGKKYVYTISISGMELKVTAKVVDWDVQDNVDIDASYDVD